MIPTDTGYISAAYVHALNRNTDEAFNLLEDWKKKRQRKISLKKYKIGFQAGGPNAPKYGWPGFAVSKMLLDSLAYGGSLKDAISLCDLLRRLLLS